MSDLVIRPLRAGEEQLFLSMPATFAGNRPSYDRQLYSPSRTWVALRGNEVVARAAWAAEPGTEIPVGVDWFDLTTESDGAQLLRAAHETLRDRYGRIPEYHIMLQPGWRERPAEREGVELRLAAAQAAGLHLAGERVRTVCADESTAEARARRRCGSAGSATVAASRAGPSPALGRWPREGHGSR